MSTTRSARQASAFKGQLGRVLRKQGIEVLRAAAPLAEQGLRIRAVSRSRARVYADLPGRDARREAIDEVQSAMTKMSWRTDRIDDDVIIVHLTGSSIDSTDQRGAR